MTLPASRSTENIGTNNSPERGRTALAPVVLDRFPRNGPVARGPQGCFKKPPDTHGTRLVVTSSGVSPGRADWENKTALLGLTSGLHVVSPGVSCLELRQLQGYVHTGTGWRDTTGFGNWAEPVLNA